MTTTPTRQHAGWEPRVMRGTTAVNLPREGKLMTALRATFYVTMSLAAALFVAVVVYAGAKFIALQNALSDLTSRSPFSTSTPYAPTPEELDAGDPSGKTQFCYANPSDPLCEGGN